MSHYRQHLIILILALVESLLVAAVGIGVALSLKQPFFFGLGPALPLAIWRYMQWSVLRVGIKQQQVTIRSLKGFGIDDLVVPIRTRAGVRLRQNLVGYFLDYGILHIEA